MRIKILFIICLLLMISTFQLQAQFKDSSLGIGVMVGGSKLRGDIDNTNAGFTSGILLKYAPVPNFAIAATGTYSKLTSGLDAIKTDLYNASIFASYYFIPYSLFNPLVSLGYSKFYYFTTGENNNLLYNST